MEFYFPLAQYGLFSLHTGDFLRQETNCVLVRFILHVILATRKDFIVVSITVYQNESSLIG